MSTHSSADMRPMPAGPDLYRRLVVNACQNPRRPAHVEAKRLAGVAAIAALGRRCDAVQGQATTRYARSRILRVTTLDSPGTWVIA